MVFSKHIHKAIIYHALIGVLFLHGCQSCIEEPPPQNIASFIPVVLATYHIPAVEDSLIHCSGNYYPEKNLFVYRYLFGHMSNSTPKTEYISVLYLPEKQDYLILKQICGSTSAEIQQLHDSLLNFITKNGIVFGSKEFTKIFSQVVFPSNLGFSMRNVTPWHPCAYNKIQNHDSCGVIQYNCSVADPAILPSTYKECTSYKLSFAALETQIHRDFPPNSYYMNLRISDHYDWKDPFANRALYALIVDKQNVLNFKIYEQKNCDPRDKN